MVAGALLVLALFVSGIAIVWQTRRDIEFARQNRGVELFLGPVLLYFNGILIVALSVASLLCPAEPEETPADPQPAAQSMPLPW